MLSKKNSVTQVVFVITMLLLTSITATLTIADNEETNDISMHYSFEKPTINKITIDNKAYDQVLLSDAPSSGDPGDPSLPTKRAHILVPPKSDVERVVVNAKGKTRLGMNFTVMPVGKAIPKAEAKQLSIQQVNKKVKDTTVFPGKTHTCVGTQEYRGYVIAVLALYPVQYIPSTGELFYYKEIDVTIQYTTDNHESTLFRGYTRDRMNTVNKVDNPAVTQSYVTEKPTTSLSDQYDLLILTTSLLQWEFRPLKEYHDQRGVKTIIKTLSDVGGEKTPEDIRQYIKEAYVSWGIDYVLLGGDADVVPAKMLWVYGLDEDDPDRPYSTYMPSDLYYGCLDGPYNSDGDDKWGEPTDGENGEDVDLMAEVYVGRACVGNSEEVDNFISKTISYLDKKKGTDPYLEDIMLAGEHLGDYGVASWGGNYLDQLINRSTLNGYTTTGIPADKFSITKLYDREWPDHNWPKSEVIQQINQGKHIICHDGHSNYVYNMKLVNEGVMQLTNNEYSFVYSVGCMSGGFDDPHGEDCIAEYWTVKSPHGAFASIMNARYGFFWAYRTDGDNQRYTRQFWDAVFGENIPVISKANQDSKEDNLYLLNRSMMRWCYYQLNLFGDPTMAFHISKPPENPDKPSGSTSGKTGEQYTYSAVTSDSEGDNLSYLFDWGDNTNSQWTDFVPPGKKITVKHSWKTQGTYQIRVKAKDIHGAESDWSDPLVVSMPKNKRENNNGFSFLLKQLFPFHFLQQKKLIQYL